MKGDEDRAAEQNDANRQAQGAKTALFSRPVRFFHMEVSADLTNSLD